MNFRGTRRRLIDSLKRIPAVLAGTHPDALGIREAFWGHVGDEVFRLTRDDFRAKALGGAGRDGEQWAPLAEATLERRRRAGRADDDILVETLRTLASLYRDAPEGFVRPEPGGATIGISVPYARFHQTGVPGRLPARPIFPKDIPDGWLADFERALEEALTKVIEMVVANGGID
jgi:hypothetical protein